MKHPDAGRQWLRRYRRFADAIECKRNHTAGLRKPSLGGKRLPYRK
jgi:hypothetical protein